MASIVPSERLRRELEEIVAGAGEESDPIEAIGRLGARLILQQALEEELSEFLGRERYERRGEPLAHRNGYERVSVKTTAGPLELSRPRVRNASALGFASAIVGKGVTRTHALEALVIASFLRGLSVRDVERALEEAFDGPVLSKSTVSVKARRSFPDLLTEIPHPGGGVSGAESASAVLAEHGFERAIGVVGSDRAVSGRGRSGSRR